MIIVIEDDPVLAGIYTEMISANHCCAAHFQRGGDALACLATTTPSVIFLDVHLPDINGLDLLGRIRTDPRLQTTNVVVITADTRIVEEAETLADAVLVKPVRFAQIEEALTRFGVCEPQA